MVAIDRSQLSEIMRRNRAALAGVTNWISEADYNASIFQYGLPRQMRPFLNKPAGEQPTYSDLIAYLSTLLKGRIRYFEIGVSVGKNLFQMLHHLKDADLVGLDIEDINPVLERLLEKRGSVEWETMPGSLRKRASRMTQYAFVPNNNDMRYIAGDEFDESTWDRLSGEKFNLVFSDAYHSPDAILGDWRRLKILALIDENEFAIVWDDLGKPEMRAAFGEIAAEMRSVYSLAAEDCMVTQARGWIGPYEAPHAIGIVCKLST